MTGKRREKKPIICFTRNINNKSKNGIILPYWKILFKNIDFFGCLSPELSTKNQLPELS